MKFTDFRIRGVAPAWIIVGRTVLLALVTTATGRVLSFLVACHIALQRPGLKSLLIYLVTLPFRVSMIVRVYSWAIFLGKAGCWTGR